METKYCVSTTMGDSMLDLGDRVYVQVSPSCYVRKSATDINVGDMIYYRKPYASTTLDDIDRDNVLQKSPRYAHAEEMLYETNSHGDKVSRVRLMLFRGLADHHVIPTEDVERKALYESDDFSREDYERMGYYIQDALERNGKSRSLAAIDNWLRGETLAPSDWDIFRALEGELNPEFAQFVPYQEDPNSMYFNYQLYNTIRRGVMRYLNGCRETHGPPQEQPHIDPHISLSPEYAIVFEHFFGDKSEEYATARVTRVEKVLKRRHLDHIRATNPRLGEGIVRDELEMLEESLKSYPEIYGIDMQIIYAYFGAVIEDYTTSNHMREEIRADLYDDHFTGIVLWNILPYMYERFGEGLDEEMLAIKEHNLKLKEIDDVVPKYGERIVDGIFTGDVDRSLNVGRGSVIRLAEASYQLRSALPRLLIHFSLHLKNDESADRTRKDLAKRYGFEFDANGDVITKKTFLGELLLQAFDKYYESHPKISRYEGTIREALRNKKIDENIIEHFAKRSANEGDWLVSREDARRVLEEYHLGNLLFLRESDFVWEQFV